MCEATPDASAKVSPVSYALRLEVFEGPLDLLLHLIRAHKVDICDIPIAAVTEQYLDYLAAMEELNLEVAGEFLVMAATLMEIKSRALLPQQPKDAADEDGPDPRQELIRRLEEYARYQQVAEGLRRLEAETRRSFPRLATEEIPAAPLAELTAQDLLGALRRMLLEQVDGNGKGPPTLKVEREPISLQERVVAIRAQIRTAGAPVPFSALLPPDRRTRRQIIVTFLALLELLRLGEVSAWQEGPHGDITLRATMPPPTGGEP